MADWLDELVGEDLISVFEGIWCTEDAVMWLREKPRTFRELRAEEIDWLRWMAAAINPATTSSILLRVIGGNMTNRAPRS